MGSFREMWLVLLFLAGTEPRPIADAEREAVAVAAAYLTSGPSAVPLAPDAPLAALPREQALQEIAVRLGPREGATWTLRTAADGVAFHVRWPSGFEDGLLFQMRGAAVHSITTLGEPNVGRASARPSGATGSSETRPALIVLCVVCVVLAIFIRRWRLLFIAAAAGFGVVAALPYIRHAESPPLHQFPELRALLPLRNALARGESTKIPNHPVAKL